MATETWIIDTPRTLDVDDITALTGSLVAGSLTVVGRDEPGASIEVTRVQGQPIQVTLHDGRLTVGYDFLDWDAWLQRAQRFGAGDRADVTIYVERTIGTRLGGVTAEGLLSEMTADCTISTASGAITADRCRGLLRANTVSGDLAVRDQTGSLRANAVSGKLTVSGELAAVDVKTVSGDVMIDLTTSSSVVRVNGVNADVTVRLGVSVGCVAQLHAVNGSLYVDGVREGATTFGAISKNTSQDGSGCHLDVNTITGKVSVVHREEK